MPPEYFLGGSRKFASKLPFKTIFTNHPAVCRIEKYFINILNFGTIFFFQF
jgi:hypothetical protein